MDNMRRGKIVSNDLTRKKIQDAIRSRKGMISQNPQQFTQSELHEARKKDLNSIGKNMLHDNKSKVTKRIEDRKSTRLNSSH